MTIHPKQPIGTLLSETAALKPAITVRRAVRADHPALVRLLKRFAEERGRADEFDAEHADRHMHHALDEDMTFIAFAGEEPAGAIICRCIDVGYRRLEHIETDYVYLTVEHRSLQAVSALLDAMEALADERGVCVCVHQLDYVGVVAGEETNSRRVEALYRFRKYTGPVGDVEVRQPYARAGVTYLYEGKPARKPCVAGVRKPDDGG